MRCNKPASHSGWFFGMSIASSLSRIKSGIIAYTMQMEQVQALIFTIRQADATRLDDLAHAEKTVHTLAELAGLHALESVSHQFSPQGVSVSLLLAESHATIHTWPESCGAYLSIATCRPLSKDTIETLRQAIADAFYTNTITIESAVL